MKLIKITQFGFYSGIDSEKYIVTNLEKLVKYINAYLLREYGNYEYADILDQFIWDGYYFRGKIVDGLGEISIEVMGDVEVRSDNVPQLGEVRDFYPKSHKRSTNFK